MTPSERSSIPEPDGIDLVEDEMVLEGRIMPASNATFLGRIGEVQVVYKPVSGERPLWDFPGANLALREVAAYVVSQATGWDVVPETWLRDGSHGIGMVQRWCEVDEDEVAVTLVPEGEVPDGWRRVFDGYDGQEQPVSLVHEDSIPLRRMAIFDVIVNNADRKGGHVLEMTGGHRHGIDHGIAFHEEHKLRTVLWGWHDEALTDDELAVIASVRSALGGDLGVELGKLLTDTELDAVARRCDRLARRGRMPSPRGEWPAIPWPPF